MDLSPERSLVEIDRVFYAHANLEELRNAMRVVFDRPDSYLADISFERLIEAEASPSVFVKALRAMKETANPLNLQVYNSVILQYAKLKKKIKNYGKPTINHLFYFSALLHRSFFSS